MGELSAYSVPPSTGLIVFFFLQIMVASVWILVGEERKGEEKRGEERRGEKERRREQR